MTMARSARHKLYYRSISYMHQNLKVFLKQITFRYRLDYAMLYISAYIAVMLLELSSNSKLNT